MVASHHPKYPYRWLVRIPGSGGGGVGINSNGVIYDLSKVSDLAARIIIPPPVNRSLPQQVMRSYQRTVNEKKKKNELSATFLSILKELKDKKNNTTIRDLHEIINRLYAIIRKYRPSCSLPSHSPYTLR